MVIVDQAIEPLASLAKEITIAREQLATSSYNDIDVLSGNSYSYKITAVDNASNYSAFSNTQSIFY